MTINRKYPASARPRRLTCCCCGESTMGRQWWNRDTGFGLCPKCARWMRERGTPEEEIRQMAGIEGHHFNIPEEVEA